MNILVIVRVVVVFLIKIADYIALSRNSHLIIATVGIVKRWVIHPYVICIYILTVPRI